MEKEIKAYAVVWREKVAYEYGAKPNEILPIAPEHNLDGRRYKLSKKQGGYYIDSLAIFRAKKEAICWVEGNTDFKIVKVEIKII